MTAAEAHAALIEIVNKLIIGNMLNQETFFGSDAHKLLQIANLISTQAGYIEGLEIRLRSTTTIEQATRTNNN